MGATVEVQETDDEIIDFEKDELDSVLEADDEVKEEVAEPETEVKEEEEEVKDEDLEVKEDDKEEDAEKEEVVDTSSADEIRELRQVLRESKREMALMKARLEGQSKRITEGIEEGEEVDVELSNIEKLSGTLAAIGQERGSALDILAETMAANPKWEDLYDVCSEQRFSDIFDAVGTQIGKEQGIPVEEATLQAEIQIWSMANPYKYMYDLIKEHHPDFATKEEKTPPKPSTSEKEVKKKEPVEAAPSIAGKGGSDVKSGWTSARIDALPEDELHTVPRDIYNKYLRNELK